MHGQVASAERASTQVDARTRMGAVRLTTADPDGSRQFYEQVIGLRTAEQGDGAVGLGVPGSGPLVELKGDADASPLFRRAPGLFHLAILVPSRIALAHALARLAAAGWHLDGASDHLVSEALYVSDPEGNGIEIYRDRPREEWPTRDGSLQIPTLPLDLRELLGELDSDTAPAELPARTMIGHVHLQVSDLAAAEAFYSGILGFEVMVRAYPGALFVAAGGYHHHLGLNTWHSAGSEPASRPTVGLDHYEILLPDAAALDQVLVRVAQAGLGADQAPGGALISDPSGNRILLRSVA